MKINRYKPKRKNHTNEIILKRLQKDFNSNCVAQNEKDFNLVSKLMNLYNNAYKKLNAEFETLRNKGVFEDESFRHAIINITDSLEMNKYAICFKYFKNLPYIYHTLMFRICDEYCNDKLLNVGDVISNWIKTLTYDQLIYNLHNTDKYHLTSCRQRTVYVIGRDINMHLIDKGLFILLPDKIK